MLSSRTRTPARSLLGTPGRVARNAPSSKIRVVARVRPMSPSEEGSSCIRIVKDPITGAGDTLHITDDKFGRNESFKLDLCYGEQDNSNYIFMMELEPILPVLFRGYNATVFAYGATGSGKTHTMQGGRDEGLIPLSMASILASANAVEACVEVSYYEVYMDRCYDLLQPNGGEISVLEDLNGRIQLRNLTQVRVSTLQEFQAVYSEGLAHRKVGQTGLNDVSSRSHAVLSVTVTTGDLDDIERVAVGKLNLIDLAGNEDNRKSGNEGLRLAESGRINQSLFALSNVITALNANESRVPYRDSKLTRILQDSLGGTSCSLMIACLNPSSYQEAVHTLSLAAKSRQIVNKFPVTQEDVHVLKPDMESKLKAWREAKGKAGRTPVLTPVHRKTTAVKENARYLPGSAETVHAGFRLRDIKPSIQRVLVLDTAEGMAQTESAPQKENLPHTPSCPKECSPSLGSPLSTQLRALGRSLRQVLSPLPSNIISPARHTPQKVFECNYEEKSLSIEPQLCWTPLQKFNVSSRKVQDTLVKEYLDILNKGTREELLALKGIGERRADYILELRESKSSPIRELQDLQKIGLSEKHACTLFNTTAVRQICLTPQAK